MGALLNDKKFRKMMIIGLLLVFVVMGFIFFLFSDAESTDPEVIAAKEEAEKQANGFYDRVSEIEGMMKLTEYKATTLLESILTELGVDRIESIEQTPKKFKGFGNYIIKTKDYEINALIQGGELKQMKFGKTLVYKKEEAKSLTGSNKVDVTSLANRVVPLTEYDAAVNTFANKTKLSKEAAIKVYRVLTDIGVMSVNNISSFKEEGSKGFLCYMGETPLKLYMSGSTLSKIVIPTAVKDIQVYSSAENSMEVSITAFVPMLSERTALATGFALTVPRAMGIENEIVFPAALVTGDDTWLMVRVDDYIYVETVGDIVTKEGTDRRDFVIKYNADQGVIYLKADKDVYKE